MDVRTDAVVNVVGVIHAGGDASGSENPRKSGLPAATRSENNDRTATAGLVSYVTRLPSITYESESDGRNGDAKE